MQHGTARHGTARHGQAVRGRWFHPPTGQRRPLGLHPPSAPVPLTIDPRNPLLPAYVSKAIAAIEEVPGCISQGATPEEAIANVRDAMLGWISIALQDGRDVPQPRALGTYSGKFIVRVPSSLHADLVRTAAREGVSLNQFVATTLARQIGRIEVKALRFPAGCRTHESA